MKVNVQFWDNNKKNNATSFQNWKIIFTFTPIVFHQPPYTWLHKDSNYKILDIGNMILTSWHTMKKNIQIIYCTNFPFLVAISADTRKKTQMIWIGLGSKKFRNTCSLNGDIFTSKATTKQLKILISKTHIFVFKFNWSLGAKLQKW